MFVVGHKGPELVSPRDLGDLGANHRFIRFAKKSHPREIITQGLGNGKRGATRSLFVHCIMFTSKR